MRPRSVLSWLARRLIALLVPRAEREFFLGDLEERPPSSWAREVKGTLSLALASRRRRSRPSRTQRDPTTVLRES